MNQQFNKNLKSKNIKPNRFKQNKPAFKSGRFVNFIKKYIRPARRYIILATVLAVLVRIVITIVAGAVAAMAQVGGYDWFISVAVAGMYGLLEYKHHYKAKLRDVIINSLVLGVIFGLIIAVIDWVVIRDMWSFLNIFKKPIIIGLIFSAVSAIGFVFHKK